MKIEFTSEDLDYLAGKIAEIMMQGKLPTTNPSKKLRDVTMSVRLMNALAPTGLQEYRIYELSEISPNEWKRLRNLGPKAYAELMQIFAEAGCSFGNRRINYNRETMKYTIV